MKRAGVLVLLVTIAKLCAGDEQANAKYLWGIVLSVNASGIVVGCRPLEGGISPIPPGTSAPPGYFRSEVRGEVFLIGHPSRAQIADGDVVECNAFEDGVTTVGVRTLHKWRWNAAGGKQSKAGTELARLILGMPPAASQTFAAAWTRGGPDGLTAKRSWMAMWANRLPDPNKAMVQLNFVTQLVGSESGNGSKLDRLSRAREARGMLAAIRTRCARWPDVIATCGQLEQELAPTLSEMERP